MIPTSASCPPRVAALVLFAAVAALSGCSRYASISKRRPEFRAVHAMTGSLGPVERHIKNADARERREPLLALGDYLTAAQVATEQLAQNPKNVAARDAYNFAVSRVLGTLK